MKIRKLNPKNAVRWFSDYELSLLQKSNEEYTLVKTSVSTKLIFRGQNFWTNTHKLDVDFMRLIQGVHNDALAFKETGEILTGGFPNYFKFKNRFFENRKMYEIDVNAAYWHVAGELFLSQKTYNLGLERPKKERLSALGILARKQKYEFYKGSELLRVERNVSETRDIYKSVVSRLDYIIGNIMENDEGAVGYWVDAIFSDSVEFAADILDIHGLKCKIIPVSASVIQKSNAFYFQTTRETNEQRAYFMFK
jgi:hypothetical protein